jgi:nitrate/nitrite transporter NarK
VLITPIFIYLIFFLKTTDAIETSDQTNNALKPNKAEALSLFFNDLARLYQNPRTLLPGIVFLFHTCMFVALLTFIPRLSPDEGIKNQLYILLPIISILGTFIAGVLAQYYVTPQRLGTIAYLGVALFSGLTFLNIESSSLFFSFASCILLFSGLVAGSAFAMIPHLARSHDEQAKSNGAIAQLGNLGATIGPPVFATGLAQFQSIGMLWMILGLCLIGTTVTLYASRFRPLKINE